LTQIAQETSSGQAKKAIEPFRRYHEWDGKLETLAKYMEPPIEFYWLEGKKGNAPIFLLRVNNWTILDDIKRAWGQVSKYQNEICEKKERRASGETPEPGEKKPGNS
jgi:hypothetical protein